MISNCGHDENGKYIGGKPGDQTGGEYTIREWYKRPWNYVARYPDENIRKQIAKDAELAAKNNKIGYAQDTRLSFWNELVKVKFQVDKIDTKCNADCSSSTAAIIKGVGYKNSIDALKNLVSESMTTFNSRTMLRKAGFQILTASKYLNSDAYLMPGDILVNDNHHMAINLSYGDKAEKIQNEPKKSTEELAKEVIEGKWGNGEDRKAKLQAAGYDYSAVQKKVNELLKTSKTTKYKVINVKSFLNVRTGPSVNYASVGKYYNGDIVEVETITKGWAKIVNKYPRYVSVNYLSKLS